jgi:hypothetical protein
VPFPPGDWPDHPAFRISVGLGALGVVLLFIGAVSGLHAFLYLGVGSGAGSLVAALAWRAELVSAWRRDHPRGKL